MFSRLLSRSSTIAVGKTITVRLDQGFVIGVREYDSKGS